MSVTTFDTEFWIEEAWKYAIQQNTQLGALGISSANLLTNPTIDDEVPFPHVEVECVAVYPASSVLSDKEEICEVEITVRTSKGIDAEDPDSLTSIQRQLLGKICGAIRQVLCYNDDAALKSWLRTGGNNRAPDSRYRPLPLVIITVIITNSRYQPENITCVDVSTAHYHARRFTVTTAVVADSEIGDP
jgi:hypothetical protein